MKFKNIVWSTKEFENKTRFVKVLGSDQVFKIESTYYKDDIPYIIVVNNGITSEYPVSSVTEIIDI